MMTGSTAYLSQKQQGAPCLWEGEDGGRKGRLWSFIFFRRAMGSFFLGVFLNIEGLCLNTSVLARSLWCSVGNGLQGPRAFWKRLLWEATWGCRDGTGSGEMQDTKSARADEGLVM